MLVVGIPNSFDFIARDLRSLAIILTRTKSLARLAGAGPVALAGRLPSLLRRNQIDMPPNFCDGVKGTVYIVVSAIEEAVSSLKENNATILIFGLGVIGSAVLDHLYEQGYPVSAVDPLRVLDGPVRHDTIAGKVAAAKVIVLLSGSGNDLSPWISALSPNSVILDDTHPPLSRALRQRLKSIQCKYYRPVASRPSLKFVPALPGYATNAIPGCALEALVASESKDLNWKSSQASFNAKTAELGFLTFLARI